MVDHLRHPDLTNSIRTRCPLSRQHIHLMQLREKSLQPRACSLASRRSSSGASDMYLVRKYFSGETQVAVHTHHRARTALKIRVVKSVEACFAQTLHRVAGVAEFGEREVWFNPT